MQTEEIKIVESVALSLERGLAPSTCAEYRRQLRCWMDYMQRRNLSLSAFDMDAAYAWFEWNVRKMGKISAQRNRRLLFPMRCVEVVQQLRPEMVSQEFIIPRSLWVAKEICYRDSVIEPARIDELIETCVRDIEATTVLSKETVIAFVVLLAIRTGMNADSLKNLSRECLVPTENGHHLYWYKSRSDGDMCDFYAPLWWGPAEIVRRVQELTQDPEFLWVVSDSKTRPYSWPTNALNRWCSARGLPAFALEEIRPAMASIIYERSGENIAEVQRFLHHKKPSTTVLYLADNVVRPLAELHVAMAQENIFRRWGVFDSTQKEAI